MRCLIISGVFGRGVDRYADSLYASLINVASSGISIYMKRYTQGQVLNSLERIMQSNNSRTIRILYSSLSALSKFHFTMRRFKYYHLFHLTNPNLAPILRHNSPSLITVHDLMPFALKSERDRATLEGSLLGEITRKAMHFIRHADRIISISEYTKKDLLRFIDVDPRKVRVIYYGVDHELFKPRDKLEARRRLELPSDRPIILNVGSEEPRKNIPILLKSFKELLNSVPDALLVRVGERTARIEKLIRSLVKTLEDETEIGAVQGKILRVEDKKKIDCFGYMLLKSGRIFLRGKWRNRLWPMRSKMCEILSAQGSCLIKNLGFFNLLKFMILFHATNLAGALYENKNLNIILITIIAMSQVLLKMRSIWQKRKRIQILRKISDCEFLPRVSVPVLFWKQLASMRMKT